jgi:hypothetical protein
MTKPFHCFSFSWQSNIFLAIRILLVLIQNIKLITIDSRLAVTFNES